MKLFRRVFVTALLVAPGLAPAPLAAQRAADHLADRLSDFNYAADYAGGVTEARAKPAILHSNPRARAWLALLLARDDQPRAALALADSILAADRRTPWGWFARAAALAYGFQDSADAAMEANTAMYRLAPRHRDVVWLRLAGLANANRTAEVVALADSVLAVSPNMTRVMVLRANATWTLAERTRPPDQSRRDSAVALWARARTLDSTDVQAWSAAGSRLGNAGRLDEGLALLRRATQLAPHSMGVHRSYFLALRTRYPGRPEQARNDAAADLARLAAARGSDPAVLGMLATEYDQFRMPDELRAAEDQLLREYPESMAAEWTLVRRYRALQEAVSDTSRPRDPVIRERYLTQLHEFVARPVHVNERLLGDAYRSLYAMADSTTHPDTLLAWILGMERYEGINTQYVFAGGAIALADRGVHLDQAERLAKAGPAVGRRRLDANRAALEGIGEYARAVETMNATMIDALGWVYFRAGRSADAEREIRRALDLNPRSMTALHHLGRVFEAAGQADSAEVYYISGALQQVIQTNPNRAALRALYQSRRGSLDGYDAYYAGISEQDRSRRRATVAAEVRAARDTVPAFVLARLEGDSVRSRALPGRVTVINFWGKWCGPCVAEMPELQRFSRQVAADTAARLLTINNDDNLPELREWMQRRGYDMPTLVDGGYGRRAGVYLYPTTWFLDRQGRVAFVKGGWSEALAEEFTWRVEILKAEP